ncbi:hypothetical protein FSBG_00502 [Fusobacterium gonidiaformans 3-1-5R]|uniref:N-acetyltransferase domain-containing protein n=2 Tax=Fusobacterium TaxID=848 RepID=E5BFX4_9FUSO|nr:MULTISPECIES: GNAT family N-acetyltransferase [Fusobacterium]EFS21005.1 hypothetical protein FSBG_00502 [Fusobacterium gonidiaformans 3-1-5R]KXA16137.1 hypothetical protein HMPREF3206_00488 [Fusobacterium equinum]
MQKKVIYIGLYIIHSKYHRQGVGKNLFRKLENAFIQNKFQKIRLAVILENTISFQFWKQMEFIEKERKIWKGKSGLYKKVVIMEKCLKG